MATAPFPPMTPLRERLLAAITAAVGGEYGLPAPEDERDFPVCLVQDSADEVTPNYDSSLCVTQIAVGRGAVALTNDRVELRSHAHRLLASIVTDMHADPTFGELADGVDYLGGGIQSEAGKFVFAEASFRVRWRHVAGNPYLRDPA
jgi:hypothetical protein